MPTHDNQRLLQDAYEVLGALIDLTTRLQSLVAAHLVAEDEAPAKPAPEPASAPPPITAGEPAPAPEPEPAPSLEELRTLTVRAAQAGLSKAVSGILAERGAKRVTELDDEGRAAFAAYLHAQGVQ